MKKSLTPTIDIIIPVYNIEDFVMFSVKSWTKQSLAPNLWNVIYVDDGSSDQTYQKLVAATKNLKNVSVIKGKHQGAALARQTGFEHGKSDWVIYLDGDEFVNKHYLRSFYRAIDDRYDLIYSDNVYYIYWNRKFYSAFRRFAQPFINGFYNCRKSVDAGDTENKMWRRETIKDVKWEHYKRGEDWVYFARCLAKIRKDAYRRIIFKNHYTHFFGRPGSTVEHATFDLPYLEEQLVAHRLATKLITQTDHKISKYLARRSHKVEKSTIKKITQLKNKL